MVDFFTQYGLFLAKVVTLLIAFLIVAGMLFAMSRRQRDAGGLSVRSLNKRYDALAGTLRRGVLPRKQQRQASKAARRARKQAAQESEGAEKRVFVLDFHGDIKATAVAALREEITTVLAVARTSDEVLLRLENSGGLVHEHGLAASQLVRIKRGGIPLTVAVDKVAASGGYMMACIADRILAAPFAVLGSIGVLAQIPNFNRLLETRGVDIEQFQAGEFKRTVTMFGKNTDRDRSKLKEELEDVHTLFKELIAEHRSQLDLDKVATGEHWFGVRALELGLVDELQTSDEYLAQARAQAEVYEVSYTARKSINERVVSTFSSVLERAIVGGLERLSEQRFFGR